MSLHDTGLTPPTPRPGCEWLPLVWDSQTHRWAPMHKTFATAQEAETYARTHYPDGQIKAYPIDVEPPG